MTRRAQIQDQDGFTLVELLAAIMISMIVLLATLQSLDHFRTSTTKQTKTLDANDQVRALIDRTVRDLRGASTIVSAAAKDLVYSVRTPTGTVTKRVCVTGNRLYAFSSTAAAASVMAKACSAGMQSATLSAGTATGFTYDGQASSATPSAVKNVGVAFSLGTTAGNKTVTSTLRSSATRRTGSLLLSDEDLTTTCNASGALLTLDVAALGTGVTVSYTTTGGAAIGVQTTGGVLIPKGATQVVANVTDPTGMTSSLTRSVECG